MTSVHWGSVAAKYDLNRAFIHRQVIIRRGKIMAVPPAIVAALGSRETRWSPSALGYGPGRWLGDPYPRDPVTGKPSDWHGCGPLQVDDRSEPDWCRRWKAGELTVEDGVKKGLEVYAKKQVFFEVHLSSIPARERLRATIAAYNCGEGNVLKARAQGHGVDWFTQPIDGRTGHEVPFKPGDYSADVIDRAGFFADNGFPDLPNSPAWRLAA